jgi:hypothetical protein
MQVAALVAFSFVNKKTKRGKPKWVYPQRGSCHKKVVASAAQS